MQRKIKNLFVLCMAVLMVLSTVACGGQENTSEPSSTGSESSNEVAPIPDEADIEWPTQPIEMIVPYSAGGDTDTWGRVWAQALTEELGVSVVVTNMSGSSGSVGSDYVKNADADGYTVLFHHNALLTSKIMNQVDWTYDAFENANILVDDSNSYWFVSPEKFPNGWEDMYAYALEAPGQLKMGCSPGSYQHLLKIIINELTGMEPTLVDAGDAATSAIECIAGRLDTMSCSLTAVKDYVESGQLIPIATYRSERDMKNAPDCPTWKELGYDVYGGYLYGTHFPKGTDQRIIDKWNEACANAAKSQVVQEAYDRYNAEELFITGEDATARWDAMWNDFMQYEKYFPW